MPKTVILGQLAHQQLLESQGLVHVVNKVISAADSQQHILLGGMTLSVQSHTAKLYKRYFLHPSEDQTWLHLANVNAALLWKT